MTTTADTPLWADELATAERERRTIPMISARADSFGVADAYEVQRLNIDRRLAEGDSALGYKLGLTSRAKQEAMGVDAPLWGRLTAGMVHDEGEPLVVSSLIHPRVESEIAFLLGRDVEGETATVASVIAATEGVFAALEILDSRYEDFRFTLPDVVADNASAARIVVGGSLVSAYAQDWRLEGMVMRDTGEVVHTAAGASVSGHPAAAVAWLARVVGRLPAGAIILSGGLTAPIALRPGGDVTAEFATLGRVTVRGV